MVTIRISQTHIRTTITFTDNGSGIPDDIKSNVFMVGIAIKLNFERLSKIFNYPDKTYHAILILPAIKYMIYLSATSNVYITSGKI